MRIRFFGMEAEIPDGWQDRSTITFAIPAPPGADSVGNVVINWAVASTTPLSTFLDQELAQLPESFDRFEVLDRGELETDSSRLHYALCEFLAGQPVRQLIMVKQLEGRVVVITGTTLSEVFEQFKNQFIAVALSVQGRAS